MIEIILVDDHKLVRDGIRLLLDAVHDINVVAEGCNGLEAIELTTEHQPHILIVDIRMPEKTGLEVVKELRMRGDKTGIIVLSMHDDEQYIIEALVQGADGYLLKDAGKEELLRAIYNVYKGKKHFSADISDVLVKYATGDVRGVDIETKEDVSSHKNIFDQSDFKVLTKRERQILSLLYEGKNNKYISDHLGKSIRTIETHRFNIMKKMGVGSIVALIKKIDNINALNF